MQAQQQGAGLEQQQHRQEARHSLGEGEWASGRQVAARQVGEPRQVAVHPAGGPWAACEQEGGLQQRGGTDGRGEGG